MDETFTDPRLCAIVDRLTLAATSSKAAPNSYRRRLSFDLTASLI
jgi:hypothetical protein